MKPFFRVNANNRVTADDYPHFITFDWAPAYRALRILDRLRAQPQSLPTTGQVQHDTVSEMARRLLPLLLQGGSPSLRAGRWWKLPSDLWWWWWS